MKITRLLVSVAVLLFAGYALAEIPAGYYTSLTGKKEGELKTAIHNLVSNFTRVSSYQALPQYFAKTDVHPNSKLWWDMYSDIPRYAPSFSGLNREHSFPKSWWGGLTNVGAYVDLNHLYPSDMKANSAKSNYPLGTVDHSTSVKFDNGICAVGYPVAGQGGGAQYVFEPSDEYKGDFARTYFYMVTTYQNLTWKYTYMVNQNLFPTLNSWSVKLLMDWHRGDPVSEKEQLRNEEVYKIQNNRNPFIDFPTLAEYLWGNKVGEAFNPGNPGQPVGKPTLVTPVQDMALDFGQVALGRSVNAQLFFKGTDLTQPVVARVYRDNGTGYFTLPDKAVSVSIPASYINREDGYWLPVTYTPTQTGEHTARILISGGGVSGSRGIELRGECLPMPVLTACTATAATDITADSYTANWTVPAGEVVDYFIVTRTCYLSDGTSTSEQIEADTNELEINGFSKNNYETYSVHSMRLGIAGPESNTITVGHDAVNDITADLPLSVYAFEGGIRIICADSHTSLSIADAMGRIVEYRDTVEPNEVIYLPAGVYILTTDQSRKPAKFIVR
ncbi:MAG: endonuclease [Bacteroidales bacterium]|nr:endonuclease [Bacteroidales bacterium]